MEKTIKAGMHLQLQKMGKSKEESDLILKEMNDPKLSLVEVAGLNLTGLQHRAVHAIQTLLNDSNYKGNLPTIPKKKLDFDFDGNLPILKITPSEFYEAFGAKKRKTSGKFQYSSNEADQAMASLKSLYNERYIIYYRKTEFNKQNKPKHFTVKVHIPLIGLVKEDFLEDMNQSCFRRTIELKNGKVRNIIQATPKKRLTHITMEVSPLFVDQINSFFVQKPKNYLVELKEKYPKASKYVYNFIEYILTQSALQKTGIIKISRKKLAVNLRMDNYIRNRKWSVIDETIEKCYEVALDLNYIKSHETAVGKTIDQLEIIHISYDRLVKVK
jgi:hypothetical protein